jgi:DNA-binding IscR family transcriptional regulator
MRLTRAGEYAVRCVLYLTMQGEGVLSKRNTFDQLVKKGACVSILPSVEAATAIY